jgi:hypothetical protein
VDLFLNFIIQNIERFSSLSKKEICSIYVISQPAKKETAWPASLRGWPGKMALYENSLDCLVDWAEKSGTNLGNYRIFPPNTKMDNTEAQLYPDRFLRHPIPFSYCLPYFLNNTKMIKNMKKRD